MSTELDTMLEKMEKICEVKWNICESIRKHESRIAKLDIQFNLLEDSLTHLRECVELLNHNKWRLAEASEFFEEELEGEDEEEDVELEEEDSEDEGEGASD